MPQIVNEMPYEQSYIGSSPLPVSGDGFSSRMGPTASLSHVLEQLTAMPPQRWVQGVRLANGEWPGPDTPAGSRPLVDDVLAARFVHMIAPIREEGSLHRARFIGELLRGFSVFGLFERFVTRGNYITASLPLERYGFDSTNVEFSHVFSFVAQHGVHPGSRAARRLHDYAASWRNLADENQNPTAQSFDQSPRHSHDVLNWPDSRIIEWGVLRHGPLRANINSTYPRFPAHEAPHADAPSIDESPVAVQEDSEMPSVEDHLDDPGSAIAAPDVTEAINPSEVGLPASPKDDEKDGQGTRVTQGTQDAQS
ncbi:hypothetical protein C8R47DRAFT_1228361 [Mycena vitilis]|nr:hypothetical protein C8R47DRAFT_1228361 [Mycena vitilis]